MRQVDKDLIYFTSCALQGIAPDATRLAAMDWAKVYECAKLHRMQSLIAYGLEPVSDKLPPEVWKKWKNYENLVIQRTMLFDAERAKLLAHLEEHKIWYVSLKGIILQSMYPRYGMREMSDNDILVDEAGLGYIHEMMDQEGYRFKDHDEVEYSVHEAFVKEPVFNFEFHWKLFSKTAFQGKGIVYYENIKDKLLKKPGKEYEYYMTPEDCYIYVTAHAARHYEKGGTGFRSLVDTYVYIKHELPMLGPDGGMDPEGRELDARLHKEFEKLGIDEFERVMRKLSFRLFSGEEEIYDMQFSPEEEKMLTRIVSSGAGGSMKVLIDNRIEEFKKESNQENWNKSSYVYRRLFPGMEFMKKRDGYRKILDKYPFLLPATYIHRLIFVMTKKRKKVKKEFNYLKKWKE